MDSSLERSRKKRRWAALVGISAAVGGLILGAMQVWADYFPPRSPSEPGLIQLGSQSTVPTSVWQPSVLPRGTTWPAAGIPDDQLKDWLVGIGARVQTMDASVIVHGDASRPMVLTSVDLANVDCRASEMAYFVLPPGASGIDPRWVVFTIGSDPRYITRELNSELGDWRLPLNITGQNIELFRVWVSSKELDCSFSIKFTVKDSQDTFELIVDDDGKPFEVPGFLPEGKKLQWATTPEGGWIPK